MFVHVTGLPATVGIGSVCAGSPVTAPEPCLTTSPMRYMASMVGVIPVPIEIAKSFAYHAVRCAGVKSSTLSHSASVPPTLRRFIEWKPTRYVLSTMLNAMALVVFAARMRVR